MVFFASESVVIKLAKYPTHPDHVIAEKAKSVVVAQHTLRFVIARHAVPWRSPGFNHHTP